MSDFFHFKQFTIRHRDSAMKVGTDGVLLGAWVKLPHSESARVQDIGSGTGIIALMLAQREPRITVVGYEIDHASAREGQFNMDQCPWSDRCSIIEGPWQDSWNGKLSDLIVSNPPYFEVNERLKQSDRKTARQETDLKLSELLQLGYERTTEKGALALIAPSNRAEELEELANETGWHLWRKAEVSGRSDSPVNRVMLQWTKERKELILERFPVYRENERSPEYQALTGDFYL